MRRTGPITVLIVDDSAMIRSILSRVLAEEPDIEVVGGATDPYQARELIIQHRPDVIILDIEMPRMDGITFLRKLMEHYPVPVIMCSGVALSNRSAALEAIEIGAIDVVAKPAASGRDALRRLGEELAEKIRAAAIAMKPKPSVPKSTAARPTSFQAAGLDPRCYLVVLGASTGGTEAIKELLCQVPEDFPPIAIVQHMPEGFTQAFAGRLDRLSALQVSEAVDGDVLAPGKALLARGGIQMALRAVGGQWRIALGTDEPVNRHCPSVDVLFDSATKIAGRQAIGIILTGMGADGAKGLLRMRQAGAITFGQNHKSCVVYGMPKVAFELGAVQHQAPPAEIPALLIQAIQRQRKARSATVAS